MTWLGRALAEGGDQTGAVAKDLLVACGRRSVLLWHSGKRVVSHKNFWRDAMRNAMYVGLVLFAVLASACVPHRGGYWHDDPYGDSGRRIDREELAAYCSDVAADRFNYSPRYVDIYSVERRNDKYVARGRLDRKGKSDKCFECKFSTSGRLVDFDEKDCR
jgi:hypothetical protein